MKQTIVYGPVLSRRLGVSLGINLLPRVKKICSLDCLYCECGWTQILTKNPKNINTFPNKNEIKEAIVEKLLETNINIEHITFAGNGEPTLHPDFPTIVNEIIKIRDELSPQSKIAILSNSTTLNNKDIRDSISKLDVKIMKLDVGNEETFIKYNRPAKEIHFSDVISGLLQMDDIIIQSLFANGKSGNYNEKNISDWINLIIKIKPKLVQVYSLDRLYPSDEIIPLPREKLIEIQTKLLENKIKAQVF
ncbi:MAG: radical SAM protein [Ignavibacteria bacterium]|nr:radical SAM protein [Ignavibacteria bacterium]